MIATILILITILLALTAATISFLFLVRRVSLLKTGKRVKGRVVALVRRQRFDQVPRFAYAVDGHLFENSSAPQHTYRRYRVGDFVEILYKADAPGESEISESMVNVLSRLVLNGFFALLLAAYALYVLLAYAVPSI